MLEGGTLGERLYDLRKTNGYKNTESLAQATGIPKSTLNHYENDEKNQSVSYVNLVALAKFYGVTTDYLLGVTTCDKEVHSDVADFKLTDEAISVLKGDGLNHKLLCNLLTNENFPTFLRNMEIFVDDLASKRISALNYDLEQIQRELSNTELPPEEEKHLATLKAGQIQSDRYFKSVLYEDLDKIILEIRESHSKNKKDPYNYLQGADVSRKITELMKGMARVSFVRKKALIQQMDKMVAVLLTLTDISNENEEEMALRRILALDGHTPEELTQEDKEEVLGILRKYNKVWG
ncbi:MAG: helix-turn-helix transcriptional regulator [Eubacteriales bacterium]